MSYSRSDRPVIFVSAGEASGDMHGAGLVKALRSKCPDIKVSGIGGDRLEQAGVSLIFHNSELAVVGFVEVLSHAIPIAKAFRRTVSWLEKNRPDLIILIDYPEFNMLLAARAKRLNIPVMYFISPQIWAWRQGRVHRLKRLVDRMVVILPFEKAFYKKYGMDAEFVGHPLVDTVKPTLGKSEFCSLNGFDTSSPLVSLLPGSRGGEIKRLLPLLCRTAEKICKTMSDIQFVMPAAHGLRPELKRLLALETDRLKSNGIDIKIVYNMTWDAIHASDMAVAASGTVTLEAALLGTPSIVIYRLSPLTYFLGRMLVKVRYASLVNLVADREILPELIQENATTERIASHAIRLLSNKDEYETMIRQMSDATKMLGQPGALQRAADIAIKTMKLT